VESVFHSHTLYHLDVSLILNSLRVNVLTLFFVIRKEISFEIVRLYTIFMVYVEKIHHNQKIHNNFYK
jgi:hypothetical protein